MRTNLQRAALALLAVIALSLCGQEVEQTTVQYSCTWSNYMAMQQWFYVGSGNPLWLESTNKAGLRCGGWTLQDGPDKNGLFHVDIKADQWVHDCLVKGKTPTNWAPSLGQITAIRDLTNKFTAVKIVSTNTMDAKEVEVLEK